MVNYSDKNSSPVKIYLFNANNKKTETMCEICSKLTKKSSEQRH